MTDEVAIVDRVQVDVDNLPDFGNFVAIPAVEPLEVVLQSKKTGRTRIKTIYGFDADGRALVLNKDNTHLVPASQAGGIGDAQWIRRREPDPWQPVGPFTPAPPGMVAVWKDGRRTPIVYFDVHGRPLAIDQEPKSCALYTVDAEDDELIRVEGKPGMPAEMIADAAGAEPGPAE